MAGGGSRSGGDERKNERAQEHDQSPQSSSHSGTPRKRRPYIEGLPADPAALSALWPEVERWLMGSLLKRRGVDHAMARDACQEVAFRLLTKRTQFESAEHFYRWMNKVAHNLISKWLQKDARMSGEDVPEGSSPDVAAAVEPRQLLQAVSGALARLSEADRRALITALRDEPRGQTKRERDRVSLQILRARKRLRDQLEGWLAGLPWWRWWSADPAPLSAMSQAAAGAVAVTVGALSLWLLPHEAGEHQQLRPISMDTEQAVAVPATPSHATSQPATRDHLAPTAPAKTATIAQDSPPESGPGPWEHRLVVVPPADAPGTTETGTSPRDAKDNALLCWGNVPHVPDTCIVHPLRREGGRLGPQS